MEENSQFREDVRELLSQYCILTTEDKLFEELNRFRSRVPGGFEKIVDVFIDNLRSVVSIVSIPFSFATNMTTRLLVERIATAEKFQHISPTESHELLEQIFFDPIGTDETRRSARNRLTTFEESETGKQYVVSHVLDMLTGFSANDDLAGTFSTEFSGLLRQGLLLIWSGFETAVRDTVIRYLDDHPESVSNLVNDPDARKRLPYEKLDLELLSEYSFNVSRSLGTILLGSKNISDLSSLKALIKPLTSFQPLLDRLDDPSLRRLQLRRNLIAHRAGIVDERYRKQLNAKEEIGDLIVVTPEEIEQSIEIVVNTFAGLIVGLVRHRR